MKTVANIPQEANVTSLQFNRVSEVPQTYPHTAELNENPPNTATRNQQHQQINIYTHNRTNLFQAPKSIQTWLHSTLCSGSKPQNSHKPPNPKVNNPSKQHHQHQTFTSNYANLSRIITPTYALLGYNANCIVNTSPQTNPSTRKPTLPL
eukprot:gene2651-1649_t